MNATESRDRMFEFLSRHGAEDLTQDEKTEAFEIVWALLHQKRKPIEIVLTSEVLKDADAFANAAVPAKLQESFHKEDCGNEYKRWKTKHLVEQAVRIYYGVPLMPKEVTEIGYSRNYMGSDFPDLGIDVGAKGSRYGSFPLVSTHEHMPQIIGIVSSNVDRVYLVGLACPSFFKTRISKNFIRDTTGSRVKNNGLSKGGFIGLDVIPSLKDFPLCLLREKYPHKPQAKRA